MSYRTSKEEFRKFLDREGLHRTHDGFSTVRLTYRLGNRNLVLPLYDAVATIIQEKRIVRVSSDLVDHQVYQRLYWNIPFVTACTLSDDGLSLTLTLANNITSHAEKAVKEWVREFFLGSDKRPESGLLDRRQEQETLLLRPRRLALISGELRHHVSVAHTVAS